MGQGQKLLEQIRANPKQGWTIDDIRMGRKVSGVDLRSPESGSHLSREDGPSWVALVPVLPGCMSDGETALESLANVEGAIEEWKDAAMAMGRPIPSPDSVFSRLWAAVSQSHLRAG